MRPICQDPWFTFRFAEERIITRFHLEGVEAGQRVSVFKIDPSTNERLGLLATGTVDESGWVDLEQPLLMRAGQAFIAVPEPAQEREREPAYSGPGRCRNPRSISPSDRCCASASLRQRSQMTRPSTPDECSSQAGLSQTSHSR